jgi:hypothetical protein
MSDGVHSLRYSSVMLVSSWATDSDCGTLCSHIHNPNNQALILHSALVSARQLLPWTQEGGYHGKPSRQQWSKLNKDQEEF